MEESLCTLETRKAREERYYRENIVSPLLMKSFQLFRERLSFENVFLNLQSPSDPNKVFLQRLYNTS